MNLYTRPLIAELKRLDKERTQGEWSIERLHSGTNWMGISRQDGTMGNILFQTCSDFNELKPEYKVEKEANEDYLTFLANNALPIITALQEQIEKMEEVIGKVEKQREFNPDYTVSDCFIDYENQIAKLEKVIEQKDEALECIESKAPKDFEPDCEYWGWGNSGDVYYYGQDVAHDETSKIAAKARAINVENVGTHD